MWIRADLKERAKAVLRKYYWIAFLVTLVAWILGGTQSFGGPRLNYTYRFDANDFQIGRWDWNGFSIGSSDLFTSALIVLLGALAISGVLFIAVALGYAFRIFVGGPIETGMDKYFLEAREDRSDFVNLFYAFRAGRYLNVVKAIAWRELFTFLWTLLFIIPGIVKSYAYAMIPYIMAENPGMDYGRAMKLSMAMTDGQKWEMFVLDLSFIGWCLLGLLACCVGVLFVSPYYFATRAELYAELKRRAMESGKYEEAEQSGYVTKV